MEERRQKLADMFNTQAPVSKTLGARLTYKGDIAVLEMPYKQAFDTAGGNVHGGLSALLLDTVMWFTVAPHTDQWLLTATINVVYMRPMVKTLVRAEGKLIRAGKSQLVAEGYLYDEQGNACSHATATFLVSPPTTKNIGFPAGSKL